MNKRLFVGQLLIVSCLLFVACFLLLTNKAEAKVLLPNGAGTYSNWLNNGGGVGTFDKVNEYPNNDGDTAFNNVSTEGTAQSYNFQDNSDSGSIRGIRAVAYAKINGTNPEYLRLFLYNSANGIADAPDACTTINNSLYTQCSYYWSAKPSAWGGGGWSVSDLTGLQAGFRTEANGTWDNDEHRVTQFYLDVDFKTETKKAKYYVEQQLVAVNGVSDNSFTFGIADPIDAVQSAFIEIGGIAQPVGNVSLEVKVDDSASTPAPGSYDKTYVINATGRPTSFKINHDVTDYLKQFVNSAGSYTRYLHLKTDNNIYLLRAKLIITYTYIIPPAVAGAYRAKAELTSAVFDTGVTEGVAYNSVMWKGSLGSPNQGKVRIKIATSNSDAGPWTYIGPASGCSGSDGGDSDWFVIAPDTPTEIKCFSSHNNKQFFRYKIQLCSASGCDVSGNGNPEVTDVIISWSP